MDDKPEAKTYHLLIGDLRGGSVEVVNNLTLAEGMQYALEQLNEGTVFSDLTLVCEVPMRHIQHVELMDGE